MKWHYDLCGAEPIIRDIPVYSAAIICKGTPMSSGVTATELNNGRAIVATGTALARIIGVTNEEVTAADALAVNATGHEHYAKLIINPYAVYLAQYDVSDTYDITNTVASATGVELTSADNGEVNQTGFWLYVTNNVGTYTAGGFGNLFCAGAVTAATGYTATTGYTSGLKATTTSDHFIAMYARYGATIANGTVNLVVNNTTGLTTDIAGQYATSATGHAVVLENYIVSKARPMEPLVNSRHSGYNYAGEDPDFYADVFLADSVLRATYTRAIA